MGSSFAHRMLFETLGLESVLSFRQHDVLAESAS